MTARDAHAPLARAAALLGAAVAIGSCGAPGGGGPASEFAGRTGAVVRLPQGAVYDEIARLEDARTSGGGRLQELARGSDPGLRARAVTALGRLPFPELGDDVTRALCRALDDPAPQVRRAAAFALGVRADASGAGCLVNHWGDPDPGVRTALAAAAAHLDVPAVREAVLRAVRDPDPGVRAAAVQATALWDPDGTGADEIDAALVAALAERPGGEIAWRALYALSRRRADKGLGPFLEHVRSESALERLFSARGLGRSGPSPRTTGAVTVALVEALGDVDWRVAAEAALALAELADPGTVDALARAVEHPSHHVRRAAVRALGRIDTDSRELRSRLWRGVRDLSSSVRAEAVEALARSLPPVEALTAVEDHLDDSDPLVRLGAARGAARLPTAMAVPLLLQLSGDQDRRVAQAALAGLGEHPTPEAREHLLATLTHPDNGLVLAATLALRSEARAGDVPHLREALEGARGDIAAEIALNVVETLDAIESATARKVIESALKHPDRFVRRTAREALGRPPATGPPDAGAPQAAASAGAALAAAVEPPRVPVAGVDYPRWRRNPLVEIETTRGSMLFELFPAETPLHVHNFLELAEAGHYDGLIFHRVVPDFVVQGGDYRGDGNGGLSWRGDALRHEFTPRPYLRGSLGMPRYQDPDSGGSQIFVTHRPTPHLDGRYTLFGQLRAGGHVLDRIEIGDRILGVRRIEAAPEP